MELGALIANLTATVQDTLQKQQGSVQPPTVAQPMEAPPSVPVPPPEKVVDPAEANRKAAEAIKIGKLPSLNEQVTKFRKDEIKKEMNPTKGKAEAQHKIDLAGDKNSGLVQIARRIGRELAANGPITIDEITAKMAESYNVLPAPGKKRQSWKGSVFTRSEWA